MLRYQLALLASIAILCQGQDAASVSSSNRHNLAAILNFEMDQKGSVPAGWGGGPAGTIFVDGEIAHSGKWSARLERHADSEGKFSSLTKSIPVDFKGQSIQMRGFLRTEDVSEYVGLWLREDADSGVVAFDKMQSRQVKGTNDWTEYTINLPLRPQAKNLVFGVLIAGTGKVWADDLQLLVDGKPIWDAPYLQPLETVLDRDHEFDAGSRIILNDLTKVQIENLATLGRVWGFLKYRHPDVTSGKHHWDYELFRVMPAILNASGHQDANAAMLHWIEGLGTVKECEVCAQLHPEDLHLRPELNWISDENLLGKELSQRLLAIHRNRPADGKQFYVSLVLGVKNPSFDHEPGYARIKLPDPGFQILAAYRFWNVIEYWSPYRDVLGENWDQVLIDSLPRIALAKNAGEYQRELMMLIARAHDTHANLWSSLGARPPVGGCQLPVEVRFVDGRAVVAGFAEGEAGIASGLKRGDVITHLDGVAVSKMVQDLSPYYAASNEPTRLRDIARSLTRGTCGDATTRVQREGGASEVTTKRVSITNMPPLNHELPGPAFRLLSKDVGYVKLSSIKTADAAHFIDEAAGTKGLIIDDRSYPSDFPIFALGSLLVDKPTEFVRFTNGDLSNPGAFHWTTPLQLQPKTPHYAGKVVILIDETTQSSAEYHSMAFRSAAHAVVVGSTTAGADGNVSEFSLPGGLRTMISGIGIFYPDKKPTQRIGIVPDIESKPTIAGIRDGRDEVLEAALRQILGRDAPADEIEKMARPGVGR